MPAECPDLVGWQRAQRRDVSGGGPAPDGAYPDDADTQRRFRNCSGGSHFKAPAAGGRREGSISRLALPGVIGTTASWTGMNRSTSEYGIRPVGQRFEEAGSLSDGSGRARPGRSHAPLFRLGWARWILHLRALEAEDLVNQDDGDAAGHELAVDDEDLVDAAVHAIRRLGAGILEREDVLVDAAETFLEVGHDLLRPHDEDQSPRTADIGAELAATGRGREQRSTLGDRMHAAEHDVGH